MSFFTSLAILLFALLILLFLGLGPGVFSIFFHAATAQHRASRADDLTLGFILGQEIFTTVAFLATYCVLAFSFQDPTPLSTALPYILAGILFAEAIFFCLFYFKKGKTSALFIPRTTAKNLEAHASSAKTRSDAIALGFVTSLLESPFTIPLFIAMSLCILHLRLIASPVIIASLLFVAAPSFFIYTLYRRGHNLATITRLRIRYKPAIRTLLTLTYLLIAVLIILETTHYGR